MLLYSIVIIRKNSTELQIKFDVYMNTAVTWGEFTEGS